MTYVIIVYLGLFLSIFASIFIRVVYYVYSKHANVRNISASEAVRIIAERENFDISIKKVNGILNNYFDPRYDIVALSNELYNQTSIASVAIAAHEMGHVSQKFSNLWLFNLRLFLSRTVNFTTQLGYILFIVGVMLNALNFAWLGLILFSGSFLFLLVTFPIEIDASLRGLRLIKKYHLLESSELKGAYIILIAASLTYFAALVQNFGQLLRMIFIISSKKKD